MGLVRPEPVDPEARRLFLRETNAAFAELRANPQAWQAYRAEFEEFDGTLMDGLGSEQWL